MVDFLILPAEMMGCVRVAKPRSTQSANKQLATVQKRICVIEFLRLRLIIVYQDSKLNLKNPPDCGFFDLQNLAYFITMSREKRGDTWKILVFMMNI